MRFGKGMEKFKGPYNPIVMDHFTNPRNRGEMENPDGVGEAQNLVCGDAVRLFISWGVEEKED